MRFDGTRFVTYNLSNVPGLISNRIIDLGLTGDSTVFFKDTSFKVFSFDKNNQPFLLNPHIRNRYVILQSPGDQFDVIRNLIPGDRRRVESLFAAFAAQVIYNRIGARGDGFLRIGDNLLLYFYQKKIISFKTFEYGAAMAYDNAGVLGKKMYFLNEKSNWPASIRRDGSMPFSSDCPAATIRSSAAPRICFSRASGFSSTIQILFMNLNPNPATRWLANRY